MAEMMTFYQTESQDWIFVGTEIFDYRDSVLARGNRGFQSKIENSVRLLYIIGRYQHYFTEKISSR